MIEQLIVRALDYGPLGLVGVVAVLGLVWLVRIVRRDLVLPFLAAHLDLIRTLKNALRQQQKELRRQTRSLQRIESNGCGNKVSQVEQTAIKPSSPAA